MDDINFLKCSFQFHEFVHKVCEVKVYYRIMKMDRSLYIWIGDDSKNMSDLSLSFGFGLSDSKNKSTIATKIMGPIADEISCNLANKLSKRINNPVYVSYNVQNCDHHSLPSIEKRVFDELKDNPELFEF